jgi:cytochrome c oxidase cbb3-type subunit 3
MSAFWSWWVMGLIVFNLGVSFFLFVWGPRAKIPTLPDGTTGHVWAHGVLREGMHPLPRWWIAISFLMFIGAFGYLVLYPGFGDSPGRLGWTAHGQLARDTAANDQFLEPVMQRVAKLPIEQLAGDPQALAIGAVLFADNCAACHGRNARGNPLLGAPNLRQRWPTAARQDDPPRSPTAAGASCRRGTRLDQAGITNLASYAEPVAAAARSTRSGPPRARSSCHSCRLPRRDGKGTRHWGRPT